MSAAATYTSDLPIEAEVVTESTTSDYASSINVSSTQSLSSSIYEYIYENGRRYASGRLGDNTYLMPNDETEQDRLDLAHHSMTLALGGELHLAPINFSNFGLHRVLDCGTGTGIWALEMGDLYPQAEIIGVDITPIQPGWVAANVKFELDDLEKEWTFKKESFDFIHSRHLGTGIRDWPKFAQQIFDHLRPNGYVEIAEHELTTLESDDGTYTPETAEYRYFQELSSGLKAIGVPIMKASDYVKVLQDSGFEDINVKLLKFPWGTWPKNKQLKERGAITEAILETGLEAYAQAVMIRNGRSQEFVDKLLKEVKEEMASKKVHSYNFAWQIVARKPNA